MLNKKIKRELKRKVNKIFDLKLSSVDLQPKEKDIQKGITILEKQRIQKEHMKYLSWLNEAVVFHNWNKINKTEWDRVIVTERKLIQKILFNKSSILI